MDLVIFYLMVRLVFILTIQQKLLLIRTESNKLIYVRNFDYIEKKAGEKVDTINNYTLSGYPQESR